MPPADPEPLADAVAAVRRMLHWRGHAAAPFDHPALGALRHAVGLAVAADRSVVVVTDAARITTQQLRALLDALPEGHGNLRLVAKHPVNVNGQHAARVAVIPWALVLTYPLDHVRVPRHRRATAADLETLARLRLPRPLLLRCSTACRAHSSGSSASCPAPAAH